MTVNAVAIPPPPEVGLDICGRQVLAREHDGTRYPRYVDCAGGCGCLIGVGGVVETAEHVSCAVLRGAVAKKPPAADPPVVLDETRLREIGDLIRYKSSVSFTSHRAHESVAAMLGALTAIDRLHRPCPDDPAACTCGGPALCPTRQAFTVPPPRVRAVAL